METQKVTSIVLNGGKRFLLLTVGPGKTITGEGEKLEMEE